ncbi:MOSC domain-containing protein [Bradyrhizobium sp. USDA 3256]
MAVFRLRTDSHPKIEHPPASATGARSGRIGRCRRHRRETPIQQDASTVHCPHGRSWGRRRCALWAIRPAQVSRPSKSASAKSAPSSPHPARTARRVAGRRLRREPRRYRREITTSGLDLESLPLNTELRIGATTVIRLTGLRTPCVLIDRFQAGLKNRLLNRTPGPPFGAGVMAVVSVGGVIAPKDPIKVMLPEGPHLRLPPL